MKGLRGYFLFTLVFFLSSSLAIAGAPAGIYSLDGAVLTAGRVIKSLSSGNRTTSKGRQD